MFVFFIKQRFFFGLDTRYRLSEIKFLVQKTYKLPEVSVTEKMLAKNSEQ